MELVKNIKESKIVKNLFYAIIATIILAISSKIKIPFYPVPMTMQTFVVLFIGIMFGWRLGLTTITLYLFEGIVGLPVFSGTPEKGIGLIYFTGPTMGYLIGFLFAVYILCVLGLVSLSPRPSKGYSGMPHAVTRLVRREDSTDEGDARQADDQAVPFVD